MKLFGQKNRNHGSALLTSYILIVILLGLGGAFVLLSTTESRVADRHRRVTQALYIAESGLERAFYDLRQDFILDSTPSWTDGDIHGYSVSATGTYQNVSYAS